MGFFSGLAGKLPAFIFLSTVVLGVASLYWARTVLLPVALSLLLTFLLSPVVRGLERIGLGRVPSVILVACLTFGFLGAIAWIITSQLTTLVADLPKYEGNIKEKIADVRAMAKGGTLQKVQKSVEEIQDEIEKVEKPVGGKETPREVVVRGERSSTFWPVPIVIGPLVERLASAGLAIVLLIFMLLRREDLRNRLIRLIGYGRLTVTTKALEDAGDRISHYLLMQSIINSFFGLVAGISLFLVGLPYPALWGLLAGLLRFVPYVGPWIGTGMPTLLSLAVFEGWIWPIVVIGIFVALELFTNMVLETLLYADSAGVSEVALLIAVAFWTWIWGPIGLLMATPLTVCLVVLGKYVPQLEFITVLMSAEPVMAPTIVYYQRLLARDQHEAAAVVEGYLKTNPAEQVYDQVFVPALNHARHDNEEGNLTDVEEQFIFQATREIAASTNSENQLSTASGDGSKAPSKENMLAKMCILGCAAQDEADEIALLMLRQLLDSTRYEIEVLSADALAAEVTSWVREKNPPFVCIGALVPGGLAQTRYLCKRLRAEFPDLKILVGRWGFRGEIEQTRQSLVSAGADQVGTSLLETRDQLQNLRQLISDSDRKPAIST